MQRIQQTCCVDVGTLRLCKDSSGMVQIENEILDESPSGRLL